jgi:hypothetical protein
MTHNAQPKVQRGIPAQKLAQVDADKAEGLLLDQLQEPVHHQLARQLADLQVSVFRGSVVI